MVVEFRGQFTYEIPPEKFTIVLKKIKGEDAVPLFQTLTFRMSHIENLNLSQM